MHCEIDGAEERPDSQLWLSGGGCHVIRVHLASEAADVPVAAKKPAFHRLQALREDARESRQEFVIGGYTRGTKIFDALVFGYSAPGVDRGRTLAVFEVRRLRDDTTLKEVGRE